MRLLITHNKKWIGKTVQVETRKMRKKFLSVFTMTRNGSSEALASVLSNGETFNLHGERMVDKTFIWLWLKMYYQSFFFLKSQLHSAYAAVLNIYCLWVLLALVASTCHGRC